MIDTLLGDTPPDNGPMYTPVLRAKASEWKVLEMLTPSVRRRISPIIEFIPDWTAPGSSTSTRRRRAPQTPAEYVNRMLRSSATATPSGTRSFMYFGLAPATGQWNSIDLWSAFELLVPPMARVIPLADLPSVGSTSALVRAVRSRGEVGLRLEAGDVGPALGARIADALQLLGIGRESVHVFVDLKDTPAARSHGQVRAALGSAAEFASVAILAGVFPLDLTQYQPGITPEPRAEWETWWREHVNTPAGERLLAFGDYTTQCAHYRPSPGVPGSVSLRYTTDDAVLVFRGRQSNSGAGLGHEQMHGHCRLLVARADYDGASFSQGDHRIHCWTNPTNGPGNAMQWRTAAIVHHITHVVVQLQDAVGSSATVRAWARSHAPPASR